MSTRSQQSSGPHERSVKLPTGVSTSTDVRAGRYNQKQIPKLDLTGYVEIAVANQLKADGYKV